MSSSDCFKLKGVLLIVLLHVGPLAGYMVDTGQCDCLPYSEPCVKEAVLISVASAFSNRVLACLPGMRLCCDAKTSQEGRSEHPGPSDQIRGFVLQMPNMLRRNRTWSPNAGNSGLKSRSQRVAYNPLLDGVKDVNRKESELGTTVATTPADILADKKPAVLTGGVNANGYKVNAGIGDPVSTVTNSENLITVLPMSSENKSESKHNFDGYDLSETLDNSTHAEISIPVIEESQNNNSLENLKPSKHIFSSDHYESTEEKDYVITTSVYSTQVMASNEKPSNTNTVNMTPSHNSETVDNRVTSTLNFNPPETDHIMGKQKIEEAVETTLATLEQLSVNVTSVDVRTSTGSWTSSEDGDMITETSSMLIEYLVSPVLLHNSYKSSSPTVEPVTAITKEGDEHSSPFTMNNIETSKSSYKGYPVTLIYNIMNNSSNEHENSKESPGPFIPENLKGKEAAPVVGMSEDIGFVQVVPVSENKVPLVSNTLDIEDNVTSIIDSSVTPNLQTVSLESLGITSNKSMVHALAGFRENKKNSTVELLKTGMPRLSTNMKNVNSNFTELESSLQAVPMENSKLNGLDLALPGTLLLSSPYPTDEDRYKANLESRGYTYLTAQTAKTFISDGTLHLNNFVTTRLTGINTFIPEDYSKGSKSLPSEFRNFLLPSTELAITENTLKYTTTKTYYVILRPAATSSPGPTTIKKDTAKFTAVPHGSQGSDGTNQPMFVTPSSDSQKQFNAYLKSVREEANKSNQGNNQGYFNWIFG
ncbi:uncharacterized protein [Palaemon carinicauda]|uniref:uncharacterized protein n=1 Tax=Palaemon carinicauda TaxID=392227 RepID=UPI0035B6A60A